MALILTPDLYIAHATGAYLMTIGQPLEVMVGRSVFEVFPENPNDPHDGPALLRESFDRVRATKMPDRIQTFRYDIPDQESKLGFLERYWSVINSPIVDADKNLKYILNRVSDVTATVKLQKQNEDFASRLYDQSTELLLRVVADRLPAFVSYMGVDRRYRFVNAAYSSWFGRPATEIEGKTRTDLVGEKSTADYISKFEDRAFAGESCAFELTLTKPDGDFINLDVEYIPDIDPASGIVRGLVGVGQDVTARKLAFQESQDARQDLQASEARFRSLSDSLPTLMWTWQEDVGVTYINNRAMAYLQIQKPEDFAGAFINALALEEGLSSQKQWYAGVASGQFFKVETYMRGLDGTYRWFLNQVTPICDSNGDIDYWITTATDIDHERSIARELFDAKNAAENANRAKTEFLANMSHEIRTPLNAILGFSDLLKDASLGTAAREQYSNTISRNGRLLTRIIDDILDLAKVESGRLEAEEVSFALPEIVNEVLALFADSANQKGIQLKCSISKEVPSWIASDPTRLRQILINIVGNAVKFTDSGSVEVFASAKRAANETELCIRVRDTGRGIPEAQRDRLFRPFTQADTSTTRKYGGTGLGLALSRRLAEALGGSLTLGDATSEQGATFIIKILVKPTSEPTKKVETKPLQKSATTSAEAEPLSGMRILFVDDSVDNQTLLGHILRKQGAIVDVASNGREGVRVALSKPHDVVLMDIQMPDMDGYQAIAALKHNSFATPVIALTAHAMSEERDKTKAAGFSDHLTKPIDKAALLKTLKPYRR